LRGWFKVFESRKRDRPVEVTGLLSMLHEFQPVFNFDAGG
jgi:hypothetical protein